MVELKQCMPPDGKRLQPSKGGFEPATVRTQAFLSLYTEDERKWTLSDSDKKVPAL